MTDPIDKALDALDWDYGGDMAEYLGPEWRGILRRHFQAAIDASVERLREEREAIFRRSNAVFEAKDAAIDRLRAEVEQLREQESLAIKLGNLLPKAYLERDRLRGLLARLEWAGICDAEDVCPACYRFFRRHEDDCWLAEELHGTTKAAPADRAREPVDQGREEDR